MILHASSDDGDNGNMVCSSGDGESSNLVAITVLKNVVHPNCPKSMQLWPFKHDAVCNAV